MITETSVRERYAHAAHRAEAALCCPDDYDSRYLKVIPAEVVAQQHIVQPMVVAHPAQRPEVVQKKRRCRLTACS